MNLMNNGQMNRGKENKPSIYLGDRGKPRENPSQVGRHRHLSSASPEYESSVLPLRYLAGLKFISLHKNKKVK